MQDYCVNDWETSHFYRQWTGYALLLQHVDAHRRLEA